jgi:hypothetical protein
MKLRIIAIAMLLVMLTTSAVFPATAALAQNHNTGTSLPISGTIPEVGGIFEGTLNVTRFVFQGGQFLAVGTVTGELFDALGNSLGTVSNIPVRLPVTPTQATCEILELELGPIDLELLGLRVFLDEVYLLVEAIPGAGNLLGNLLCAVAGLLDRGGPLQSLANLLNSILRIL